MVIKNKDGSEYKLSKPNPHMKNQLLWDSFELHNMNFENIKGLIKKNKVEIKRTIYCIKSLLKERGNYDRNINALLDFKKNCDLFREKTLKIYEDGFEFL